MKSINLAKQIAFLFLLLMAVKNAFSQQHVKPVSKIYIETGAGRNTGNGFSKNLDIQVIFKNKWVISIGSEKISYKADNIPEDYTHVDGSFLLVIPLSTGVRPLRMTSTNIAAGRHFTTGKNSWINTIIGLSVINGESIQFTRNTSTYEDNPFFFFIDPGYSNYTYTIQKKSATGGIVRCSYNWAFSSVAGLSVTTYANINKIKTHAGFELSFIIGWMNRGNKNHKPYYSN